VTPAITVPDAIVSAAGNKVRPLKIDYDQWLTAKLPGPSKLASSSSISIYANHKFPKSQLYFPDSVDNSYGQPPWKPTLPTKQHAMLPLGQEAPIEYEFTEEENIDPSARRARVAKEERIAQHPYAYETRHLPYPSAMFVVSPPIEPKSFEETPFEYVDTPKALARMVEALKQSKEIAIDLEHHDMRSYHGFTCLMQISTRHQDWVVDTLKLRKELRELKLGGVLVDPSIVKVSHTSE
jgi:exosome complex exonuclease RRP6